MASYIKDKIMGSSDDSADKDKYHISVSASTTYDENASKQIVINGPPSNVSDNCKVAVRIKEYQGIPLGSPKTSPYFEDSAHSKDTYSVAVSWMPKVDISAEDLVWGIELINPIRDHIPKRFINTAFSIVKEFVDPSLRCDPYADKPWLNGPILCSSAITFSIGSNELEVPPILSEGSISADSSIRSDLNIPPAEDKRRKHFMDSNHREAFVFEKGRCYAFDFHNGYIDWKNYSLKLPGFSLSVLKYVNERTHTLRFVLKDRKSGELFVATTFRLLFGEELDKAIAEDEKKTENRKEGGVATVGREKEQKPESPASSGNDRHVRFAEQGVKDGKNGEIKENEPSKRESGKDKPDEHANSNGPHPKTKEEAKETGSKPDPPSTDGQHNLPEKMSELGMRDTDNADTTERQNPVKYESTSEPEAGERDGQTTGLQINWDGIDKAPSMDSSIESRDAQRPEPRGSIEESLMATATKDNRNL